MFNRFGQWPYVSFSPKPFSYVRRKLRFQDDVEMTEAVRTIPPENSHYKFSLRCVVGSPKAQESHRKKGVTDAATPQARLFF